MSFLSDDIRPIAEDMYGIDDIISNELDALKSRIHYVQRSERHTENFLIIEFFFILCKKCITYLKCFM